MTAGDRDGCCDSRRGLLPSDLNEAALEVAVAGFAALWRGRAVDPDGLMPGRRALAVEVVALLAERGRAEIDAAGHVVGIHGLTLRHTRHSFDHDGLTHHTWCAFDSVGIPAALKLHAVAHSDCPTCGSTLTVEIRGGSVDGNGLALWLPTPGGASHLINDFCAAADLYCSAGHLQQRIDVERAPGRAVGLADAAALGCETWADVVGVDVTTVD